MDHQFLDTYDGNTGPDQFSFPVSALEQEVLSNMGPRDLLPFGQDIEDECSTLASIIRSNFHTIPDSPNGLSIRSLLEDVAKKALDVSYTGTHCIQDIDKPTQRPSYIRHDVVGYADAYFEKYQKCLPFLAQDQFNALLNAFLAHQLPDDSPAIPLINSIFALGCRLVIQLKSQDGRLADEEARRYHAAALTARALYYPCPQTSPIAVSLILTAAQHCLLLKLDRINSIRALATSEEDCRLMQRIFWAVYSFEKPLALRFGRSSSIDDDFIDYSPRTIQRHPEWPKPTQADPFICQCEYAKLCSRILKQLYSNNRSTIRRSDYEPTLYGLDQLLQAWKGSALGQIDSMSSDPTTSSLSTGQHSEVLLKYHELRVTIYHKGQPCIESAREVLAQAHQWNPNLSYYNWQIVQIPVMACCIVLLDVFSNPRSDEFRNNLAFLGMAGGWFGRLATTTNNCVAFDELMELIALAQQQRKT
ncbi:hypothetical protein JMJ35_004816 [Cladonia borealis]|uniref:Transcription factor domain-containing protein n=1 Tax=Cladonia borealis TaxID=184061 RepID=A0AA39R2U5_9LECA|nr:hypothetical protein JMJ35_004816 [Cladonia borealis]